jgi:hypothetical protein
MCSHRWLPQPKEVTDVKSKIGGVIFFLILLLAVFGIISFAAEFFLGKSLIAVIKEFLFLLGRKQ